MKALQYNAEWKPKEGYPLSQREIEDKRAMRGNLVFRNPSLQLTDIPLRDLEPGEALLKVGACGVCGSDTLFLGQDESGYTHYSSHCRFPVVIGHEFSGEVVEVNKTYDLKVGDLVTGENMYWCGSCRACKRGLFNQCERLEEIGFTLNGAFAEYIIVRERNSYKLNSLSERYGSKRDILRVGCLIEPFAVVYNGMMLRAGGFQPGGHVLVYGCGPIGLAAIALARVSGASHIFAFDLVESRLKMAREFGADHAYNPLKLDGASPHEVVMEYTNGDGVALAVECTEKHRVTIPEIEKSLAMGGKVVQIGISADNTDLSSSAFQKKGASYFGSNGNVGGGFPNIINLLAAGRLEIQNLISNSFSLDDAIKAIETSKQGSGGKVIVEPWE
ncbi:MAG TPA: scyllo-inosose 3-dehydrogenase [Anaerovoracaceae bacterium]|nr:scyllo-inosose 3-dehydrogenase [Anaerovoracaceae bacterium]